MSKPPSSSTMGRSAKLGGGGRTLNGGGATTNDPLPVVLPLSSTHAAAFASTQQSISSSPPSSLPLDQPLFRPTPSSLVFKDYTPFTTLSATLQLTNRDHVSRRVRILPPKDHHFKVSVPVRPGGGTMKPGETMELLSPQSGSSKLAPGMSLTYHIEFTPRHAGDYGCDLHVVTEREEFIVPIRCIGERPSVEMDAGGGAGSVMEFGECPVHHPTIKTMLLRNNGNMPTHYSFSVVKADGSTAQAEEDEEDDQPPPFTCSPSHGLLEVEETTQVVVTFSPQHRGPVQYVLLAHLSAEGAAAAASSSESTPSLSEPVIHSLALQGSGVDIPVRLSTSHLEMDPTYVRLSSQKTVLLTNDSSVPIKFSLKRFADRHQDRVERRAQLQRLREAEEQDRQPENLERLRRILRRRERKAKQQTGRGLLSATLSSEELDRELTKLDELDSEEEAEAQAEADALDRGHPLNAADDGADSDPEETLELERARVDQLLQRKYQRLHRDLLEDAEGTVLGFTHPAVSIDPMEGEIWPKGSKELTITFSPPSAQQFEALCYLEVSGRSDRIPLVIRGRGLGAEARFSYTNLDIGTVFMNAVHRYTVTLRNIGNIPARYRLVGSLGLREGESRFSFSPDSGVLSVTPQTLHGADEESLDPASLSDRVTLDITFRCGHIGEFIETLLFELEGNAEPLKLVFKGSVIGPTFHFQERVVDFGRVSYGCVSTRFVHLVNSSSISMTGKLRIEEDGLMGGDQREFAIKLVGIRPFDPVKDRQKTVEEERVEEEEQKKKKNITRPEEEGFELATSSSSDQPAASTHVSTVPPYSVALLQLDLISHSADRRYDDPSLPYYLRLDIDGVGTDLVLVPLKAQCVVVPLSLEAGTTLDFGEVYLAHPKTLEIPLKNQTMDLPAKFEVGQQDEASKATATLTPQVYAASVSANSVYSLPVTLTPHRLGSINLPFYITIPGSAGIPFVIHARASCRGPRVTVESSVINFGVVTALKPVVQTLVLHNDSPIPAPFKAFVHRKGSCYAVTPSRGTMAPHSKATLSITATLNETLPMPDLLHILIANGDDLSVALKATGSGTTVAAEGLTTADSSSSASGPRIIDQGDHLTNSLVRHDFRLENRGRRTQVLQWEFVPDLPGAATNPLDVLSKLARLKRLGQDSELLARLPAATFTLSPSRVTLEPGCGMSFSLVGTSTRAGSVSDRWICKALVGQEKKVTVIQDVVVKANFINPFLKFSSKEVRFTQVCDPKKKLELCEAQELSFTNQTALPLRFRLKVPSPFTSTLHECTLEPGATSSTLLNFTPDLDPMTSPYGLHSTTVRQEIQVVYLDHPQRDVIGLVGELHYPNVSFSTSVLDFGSILNETSKRMLINITNTSTIEATYAWSFAEQSVDGLVSPMVSKSEPTATPSHRGSASGGGSGRRVGTPNPHLKMGTNAATLPLNELFDILPIRGSLAPGASESIEVVFHGHTEQRVAGVVALCSVEGGPEYPLTLKGHSSSVAFKLERHEINFGAQELFATPSKHVGLLNNGKVAFDFRLTVAGDDEPDAHTLPLVEVQPSSGRLKAGERIRLNVRFLSALPDSVEETLLLHVAHFEPVEIRVGSMGVYPQLFVDLPRADQWMREQEERARQQQQQQLLLRQRQQAHAHLQSPTQSTSMLIEEIDAQGNVLSSTQDGAGFPVHFNQEAGEEEHLEEGEDEEDEEAKSHASHYEDDESIAASSHYAPSAQASRSTLRSRSSTRLGTATGTKSTLVSVPPLPPLMSEEEVALWQRCLDEAAQALEAKEEASRLELEEVERDMAEQQAAMEQAMQAQMDMQQQAAVGLTSPGHVRSGSFSRGGNLLSPDAARGASSVRGGSRAPSIAASAARPSPSVASGRPQGGNASSRAPSMSATMRSRVSTIVPSVSYKPVPPPADLLEAHPEATLHMEAERLYYKYYLLSLLAKAKENALHHSSTASLKPIEESKEESKEDSSIEGPTSPSSALVSSLPTARLRTEVSNFSLSRFVCDFGPVIKNSVRTLTFRITNLGGTHATYTVDKRALQTLSGIFTIEPTSVTRLPPGESTKFTVTCRAQNPAKMRVQKKDIFAGRECMEVDVPILVRNGAPLLVRVRASVTVPDVSVSHTKLDYGRVYQLHRREMVVQLFNHKWVPATWSFSTPIGSSVRDKELFEINPSSGTLQPGERINVTIAFTPSLENERRSMVRIPLHIVQNPHVLNLLAVGVGVATKLSFEPQVLTLPATLPYVSTPPTPVVLTNHSDRPIEVYSVDFDRLFLKEEEILRGDDEGFGGVDSNHPDVMFIRPRQPGESLPEEILTRYKMRIKKMKRRQQQQMEEENRSKGGELTGADQEVGQLLNSPPDSALPTDRSTTEAGGLSHSDSSSSAVRHLSTDLVRNLLILGAPYAGKSTLARHLAPLVDLDADQHITTLDDAVRYFFELGEREAEEKEVLANKEKEYQKELEKIVKKISKDKKQLSAEEVHRLAVEELGGPLDLSSKWQVTPEERELANQVATAIKEARAKLAAQQAEAAQAAKNAKKSGGGSASNKKSGSGTPMSPAGAAPAASPSVPPSELSSSNPSPRQSSSQRRRAASAARPLSGSSSPLLFEPDADLQDYLLSNTFLDLRSIAGSVLSEEFLSLVLFHYMLIQGGVPFKAGVLIDGLDNSFTRDAASAARVVRVAFEKMGQINPNTQSAYRDNKLHVVVLEVERAVTEERMRAARTYFHSVVSDEATATLLKKFKVASAKDVEKMSEAKRAEYERTLALFQRRRQAEVSLYQIDHVDPARFDAYWKGVADSTITAGGNESDAEAPSTMADGAAESASASNLLADPLAGVLSAFDLPSFPPATSMPEVPLPTLADGALTPDEQAQQDEAERLAKEAAEREAAEAKAKQEEEALASAKGKHKKKPSTSRVPSADARKPSVDLSATTSSAPAPTLSTSHLDATPYDEVPVRSSSMVGLPALPFLKLRRFESRLNLPRLTHTILPWIEDVFRVEIDPRTLDPSYVPPPLTVQIVRRPPPLTNNQALLNNPAYIPGRKHQRTSGFNIVDPVLEEAMRVAKEAEQKAAEQRALEEAALAAEEAENKKKGGKSKSASRRATADASAVPVTTNEAAAPADGSADAAESADGSAAPAPVKLPSSTRVATRWQLPPRSSHTIYVSFSSPTVGSYSSSLAFEVVGGYGTFDLPVRALVALPEIASDPRSIFMKKLRGGAANTGSSMPMLITPSGVAISANKAYLPGEKVFDFGPLLIGKDPATRHLPASHPLALVSPTTGTAHNDPAHPLTLPGGLVLKPTATRRTHGDVWRITNTGPFTTKVDLAFLLGADSRSNGNDVNAAEQASTDRKGKASSAGAGSSARKGGKVADRSPSPTPDEKGSARGTAPTDKKGGAGGKKGGASSGLSDKELKALAKAAEQEKADRIRRWEQLRSLPVFTVEPCSFELGVDESRDITVWAFPQAEGVTVTDTLVATLQHNPEPVQFPVRCTGAQPTLLLSTHEVKFERLLLQQTSTRTVELTNPGVLPVAWSLSGLEHLPPDDILTVGPTASGTLPPGGSTTITLLFRAKGEERNWHVPLAVEVRDTEGFLGLLETLPLEVRCESYANKAHVEFGPGASVLSPPAPPSSGKEKDKEKAEAMAAAAAAAAAAASASPELNFGLLRVHDSASTRFSVVNPGSYPVGFKLVVGSDARVPPTLFHRMVSLSHLEGVVAPGARQEVVVTMRPDREIKWNKDNSLKLMLFETVKAEGGANTHADATPSSTVALPTKVLDIPLTVRSVFSHFHVLPSHVVNFGSVEVGVETRKSFTIFNDGLFDFEYRFYPTKVAHVYSRINVHQRMEEKVALEANSGKPGSKRNASQGGGKGAIGSKSLLSPGASASDKKKGGAAGAGGNMVTPREGGKTPLASSRTLADSKAAAAAGGKAAAGGGKKGGKHAPADNGILDFPPELEVGVFHLLNPCGVVPAGSSAEVEVWVQSDAHGVQLEVLELEVSNQDPATLSDGQLPRYELVAEVCSPGIDTQDVDSIFEEQEVRPTLVQDRRLLDRNYFAKEERVFVFAPVIAAPNLGGGVKKDVSGDPPKSGRLSGRGLPKKGTASTDDLQAKKEEAAAASSALSIEGRTERFRIANPFKVPAQVSFHITSTAPGLALATAASVDKKKGGAAGSTSASNPPVSPTPDGSRKTGPGGKGDKDAPVPYQAFSVESSSMLIPPREHRYVSVTFRPAALQSYSAFFEAKVEGGSDAHTKSMVFELRGEGTLPALSVVQPTTRDEEVANGNNYLLDFRRMLYTPGDVQANRATLPVVLRNDGIVPATARFDLYVRATPSSPLQLLQSSSAHSPFSFSGRGRMVTLNPGASTSLDASFHPAQTGVYSGELRMSVVSNPFEATAFTLRGEAFQQDVTLQSDSVESVPLLTPSHSEESSQGGGRSSKKEDKNAFVDVAPPVQLVAHLPFPDTSVSRPVSHSVTLVNHSATPYRFSWTPPPRPAAGASNSSSSQSGGDGQGHGRRGKKNSSTDVGGEKGSGSHKKKGSDSADDSKKSTTTSTPTLPPGLLEDTSDPTQPDFTFSPSIGHLAPHSAKTITITFQASGVRAYAQALAHCALQRIRYLTPEQAEARVGTSGAGAVNAAGDKRGSVEKRGKKQSAGDADAGLLHSASTDSLISTSTPYIPDNADWDNSQVVVRWVTEEEARARAEAEAALAAEQKEGKGAGKSKASSKPPAKTSARGGAAPKRPSSSSPPPDFDVELESFDPSSPTDSSSKLSPLVQVREVVPEPAFEYIDPPTHTAGAGEHHAPTPSSKRGKDKERLSRPSSAALLPTSSVTSSLDLRVSAVSDVSRYELTLPTGRNSIHFRPTFMYQTRVFSFVMSNPASTAMHYTWKVHNELQVEGQDEEEDEQPFSIEPSTGRIDPNSTESFTVKFSPLDSRSYAARLEADIVDLHPSQPAPSITLRGSSLRPKCHFELVSSDYVSAHRRPVHLPGPLGRIGPLDPSYRVVETKSRGVRVKNPIKFYVINPTNVSYAFVWKNEDPPVEVANMAAGGAGGSGSNTARGSAAGSSTPRLAAGSSTGPAVSGGSLLKSPFKCLTPKGVIESGRKFLMHFEYCPEVEATTESFWRFIIPNLEGGVDGAAGSSLEVPLLLVGSVSEPMVELDRTFLNFQALLVHYQHTETLHLVNNEPTPFSWSVDKSTLPPAASDPAKQVLFIEPMSGMLPPNSSMPVNITLKPRLETSYNYNVHFIVRRKPSKLAVNIKAEGYALNALVQMVDGKEEKEPAARAQQRMIEEQEAAEARAAAEAAAAAAASQGRAASASKRKTGGGVNDKVITPLALPSTSRPAPISLAAWLANPPAGGESDISHLGLDLSTAQEVPLNTDSLSLTSPSGSSSTSSTKSPPHVVDFGVISTHERRRKHLILSNRGKFNFDFHWTLPSNKLISISPMQGQVRRGNKMVITITCFSQAEHTVKDLLAHLYLGGHKKLSLSLSARTQHPALYFSTNNVDFGPCFIQDRIGLVSGAMQPHSHTLRLVNHEPDKNIAVDLVWERKEWMEVGTPQLGTIATLVKGKQGQEQQPPVTADASASSSSPMGGAAAPSSSASGQTTSFSNVLSPGGYLDLPLVFRPSTKSKYTETLRFEINNGLYNVDVHVSGEGIPLRLELEEEGLKLLDFGAVRAGGSVTRTTSLINRSRKAVTFMLAPSSRRLSANSAAISRVIKFDPAPGTEVTLKPRESMPISFVFSPTHRMSTFTQEVNLSLLGMQRRLVLLSGSCLGVGLRFDQPRVDFGSVIESSTRTRSFLLQNIGDVPCKFRFAAGSSGETALHPHYSLHPMEGLVQANSNLSIEVTFHPRRLGGASVFEKKVPCLVDDKVQESHEGAGGLILQLGGSCEPAPNEGLQELRFEAPVRQESMQVITLSNDTLTPWTLRPTFRNGFWSGDPTVEVPAGGKANYTIHYTPLEMTEEQGEGTTGASTKDAKGKKGAAAAAADKRSTAGKKELPRRPSTSSSSVNETPSRPRSSLGVQPNASTSSTTSLSSATAAALSRPYPRRKLHEGSLFFPLPTGNALSFKLLGVSTPPPIEEVIQVSTQAKRIHVLNLRVKNWLPNTQRFRVIIERNQQGAEVGAASPTAFSPTSASSQLTALTGPPTIDVPGLLERRYKLNFYAYKEGLTVATVTFLNEESGEYVQYELQLTAKEYFVDESALAPMSASVRQLVSQPLTLSNPLDQEATFTRFSCTHPAVSIAVPFTVPAKGEGGCEVRFRPLAAHKEQRCVLSLYSEELGEFQYAMLLSAAGVGSERQLRFETDLGHSARQTFRFISYATRPPSSVAPHMEYDCRISGKEFSVDGRIAVAWADPLSEGVPVAVEVRYEPSAVGEVRDMLTIAPVNMMQTADAKGAAAASTSSSKDKDKDKNAAAPLLQADPSSYALLTSGSSSEYSCLLVGSCAPPKPAGPLTVSTAGNGLSLRFKNVLSHAESFLYSVDNPAFILAKRGEKLASKAVTAIQVTYKPQMAGEAEGGKDKRGRAKPAAGSSSGTSSPAPSTATLSSRRKPGEEAADAASSHSPTAAQPSSLCKLTVSCPSLPTVSWVTYLQGQQELKI